MRHFLDFEKPIAELEGKIEELRHLSNTSDINIAEEVSRLEIKVDRLLRQTYAKLTPWQKVQLARHPDRPHGKDYIAALITEFTPLAGDRAFAEDRAIIGGLGRFRGRSVVVVAHEKGADTEGRLKHNFGAAPDGARRPLRAAAPHLHRHGRRLSRHRRRGARPGGSDRALDRGVPAARRAAHRYRHWRRRLGRRAGARRRQQGAD